MPRIPVIPEQVGVPRVNVSAPAAAIDAGADPAARALGQLGAGVTQIAAEQLARDSEAEAVTWVTRQLGEARESWTEQYRRASTSAPPGAPDFTRALMTGIDQDIEQRIATAPNPRAQQLAFSRFSSLRDHLHTQAFGFEMQQRQAQRLATVEDTVNRNAGTVRADPGQFTGVLGETVAAIEALPDLTPDRRQALSRAARLQIGTAMVNGLIDRDPSGTRAALRAGRWSEFLGTHAEALANHADTIARRREQENRTGLQVEVQQEFAEDLASLTARGQGAGSDGARRASEERIRQAFPGRTGERMIAQLNAAERLYPILHTIDTGSPAEVAAAVGQIQDRLGTAREIRDRRTAGARVLQLSDADIDHLTRVRIAEAGNQGSEGNRAVVSVVLNRLAHGSFGASVREVLEQRNQFEPVGTAQGNVENLPAPNRTQLAVTRTILEGLQSGELADPTGGALYFLNRDIAQARGTDFGQGRDQYRTVQIRGHTFYARLRADEAPTPAYRLSLAGGEAGPAIAGAEDGSGYAGALRDQEAVLRRLQQRERALRQDPAAVAGGLPNVSAAYAQADRDPARTPFAIALSLAEQERLGVPEEGRRVLTDSQARGLVARFTAATTDPARAGEQLEAMQRQYGAYWPQVWRELVRADMPDAAQVVGWMDRPHQVLPRQMLIEALRTGRETLERNVGTDAGRTVREGVSEALADFQRSVALAPDGGQVFARARDATQLLALRLVERDRSPAEAVRQAADAVVNRSYSFVSDRGGVYRVPVELDVDQVRAQAQHVLDNLPALQLTTPMPTPGMTAPERHALEIQADAERNTLLQSLQARGRWVTTPAEDGLMLLDENGAPVIAADGRFVRFSWAQVAPRPAGTDADPAPALTDTRQRQRDRMFAPPPFGSMTPGLPREGR